MGKATKMRQAGDALAADERVIGVPEFAPTPERLAHGRVRVEPIIQTVMEGTRDRAGDRPDVGPRKVVMGYARRAEESELSERLKRFRGMSQTDVDTAERYERTWNLTGLEPRMTANYAGSSGGGANWATRWPDHGLTVTAIDARKAHHAAQSVLMGVGSLEVCRVVDAVVLFGEPAAKVGSCRYSAKPAALAHVRAMLDVGLGLLAAHYANPAPKVEQ